MTVSFIICEYNPFHNGHLYHLQETKRLSNSDFVICLMSGDIVQRGQIAIADKYTRATWAINGGADVVIELPCEYVLGSAELFALGAIKIANLFDSGNAQEKHATENANSDSGKAPCNFLSFGSESGDLTELSRLATLLSPTNESLQAYVRASLGTGKSYATAVAEGTRKYCLANNLDDCSPLLSKSNDILALAYLQAIASTNSRLVPLAIRRIGQAYNETELREQLLETGITPTELSTETYPSASAVRESLFKCNKNCSLLQSFSDPYYSEVREKLEKNIPEFVYYYILTARDCDDKLFALAKYKLLNMTGIDGAFGEKDMSLFEGIFGVKEGIENRILSAIENSYGWADFVKNISSKRYSTATAQRLLLSILLDNHSTFDELKNKKITTVNVLAAKKSALHLLGNINANVITKPSDMSKSGATLPLEQQAYNLFSAARYHYSPRMRIVE
ncbi:MAG: nucleotidyltransferase family protein [Clostridia bacterium]